MLFFIRIALSFLFLTSLGYSQTSTTAEEYINIIESTSDKDVKFEALDSLIFALKWDEDPKLYAEYTDVYIDLAIARKQYKDAIHSATFAFNAINNELGQPERAIAMLERVEVYADLVKDSKRVGMIYLKKGGAYYNGKDFSKAIENYTKAEEIFSEKDSIFEADAIFFRGQALFLSGKYVDAIKDFKTAGLYYENLNDIKYMFYTQSNIASTYGANGFHEKSIEERQKLIDKKIAKNFLDGLAAEYYNQSINYGRLNNIQAQEENLLLAVSHLSTDKHHHNIDGEYVIFHSAIASFYTDHKDLEKAKDYLNLAQSRVQKFKEQTQYLLAFHYAKAKYLFNIGRSSEAQQLAMTTLESCKKWGRPSMIIKLNDLLYQINQEKGNYNKALSFYQAKTKLQDSIFSKEKTNAFSYYQTLYETELKEKEISKKDSSIKILEQEKLIEEGKTKTLVVLLVFLITLAGGFFYFLRQRAARLKRKLKYHKEELLVFTNRLLAKSREHDVLQEELENLKSEKVAENKLDKLQELVSSKILTADDWKEFKTKFEKVYPNFLVKARLNNNLTNAEERLLTLEKLNLKTSEIADVLGVSADSVIKNRYRLRKKLGLSKSTPIIDIVEV